MNASRVESHAMTWPVPRSTSYHLIQRPSPSTLFSTVKKSASDTSTSSIGRTSRTKKIHGSQSPTFRPTPMSFSSAFTVDILARLARHPLFFSARLTPSPIMLIQIILLLPSLYRSPPSPPSLMNPPNRRCPPLLASSLPLRARRRPNHNVLTRAYGMSPLRRPRSAPDVSRDRHPAQMRGARMVIDWGHTCVSRGRTHECRVAYTLGTQLVS